jgi:hypothetical protein
MHLLPVKATDKKYGVGLAHLKKHGNVCLQHRVSPTLNSEISTAAAPFQPS